MRYTLFLLLLVSAFVSAGDSKYSDMPAGINAEMKMLLDEYEVQARDTIDHFNKRFSSGSKGTFYVITRLYEGSFYEQIFVKLQKIEDGFYKGVIASTPMGKVKFKSGDSLEVKVSDITDWLIVLPDGKEEGNLQGKAIDLFQVGKAAFISKMTPKDGKFESFTVVSVLNPHTKQEVIDIVPEKTKAEIESYLAKLKRGTQSVDNKEKYTYTIVNFPGWQIADAEKR
jgi:uncharacterized protein YegJ (DUF2314 family)